MSWVAVGVAAVSTVASVASSAEQNKKAGKAFEASASKVKTDYDKVIAQLQEQASSSNDAIRLEMSQNRFEGLKNTATTSNMIVERNIAGNLATKQYDQSIINQTMTHNALAKKAEDNMVSFGVEMENKKQEANNAIYSGGAMAQANSVSGVQMATSAVSAGMSGYSMGSSLGSLGGSGDTSVLSGYKSVSERNARSIG